MSRLIGEYTAIVTDLMKVIAEEEEQNILKAAEMLSDKVIAGKLINVFGAGGHSAIAAMEIFWRAGGLAQVNAMFPVGTNIISAGPTTAKVQGLAPFILNFYDVYQDDVLILVNFYGLSIISVDVAIEAKKRGCQLITVNAHKFAKKVPKISFGVTPAKKTFMNLPISRLTIMCHTQTQYYMLTE